MSIETEISDRKVLAVDDNRTNLALLKVYLKQMGLEPLLAESPRKGLKIAQEEIPDLILLDIMMPEIDGYEVCKILKSDPKTKNIPVIFVSAKEQTKDKIAGFELGAIDYITKPFEPAELKARVSIILKVAALQAKLVIQAHTDELTGLANRRHFLEIFDRELLRSSSQGTPLSLLMLDIDHFKSINDTYGHLGGDAILQQFAEILKENIAGQYPLDVTSRYGGEEFAIIMPQTKHDLAMRAAERIRQSIQNCRWRISTEPVQVTASIGLAVFDPVKPVFLSELIEMADAALYTAKGQGRNCVVSWDNIRDQQHMQSADDVEMSKLQEKIVSCINRESMSVFKEIFSNKNIDLLSHAERVMTYVTAISQHLDISQASIEHYKTAAFLHDIGKILLPDFLLTQDAKLDHHEQKSLSQHMLFGVKILAPLGIYRRELPIIKHHHEYFDGTGKPDGLKEKRIPFGSRVVAVADRFDILTAPNQGNDLSCQEALEEIAAKSERLYDPDVVKALQKAALEHEGEWPLCQNHSVLV